MYHFRWISTCLYCEIDMAKWKGKKSIVNLLKTKWLFVLINRHVIGKKPFFFKQHSLKIRIFSLRWSKRASVSFNYYIYLYYRFDSIQFRTVFCSVNNPYETLFSNVQLMQPREQLISFKSFVNLKNESKIFHFSYIF